MRKPKVVLKATHFDDNGFCYQSSERGDDGLCFTMAIGYAVSLAKRNNVPLKKFNEVVKDIYKETEDINDED